MVHFIPNLANFGEKLLLAALEKAEIKSAGFITLVATMLLIFFFVSMILEVLGIGRNIIMTAFSIIFGGIVLALALAFGLGGKELAKEYLEKRMKTDTPS